MEQSKTLAVSVSAKEFVTYQCSQCGHCCRRIEGCVMVESLDAYRMAKHLREQHCGVSSMEAVPQLLDGLALACEKAMQHDCFD